MFRTINLRRACVARLSRSVHSLGVVGGGQMGTGIAIVGAARAKLVVTVVDVDAKKASASKDFAVWRARLACVQARGRRAEQSEKLSMFVN